MPEDTEIQKIDLRLYLGMILFRWKIIAVCFLASILGGVLYLTFVPKKYVTQCSIMAYRDPNTIVGGGSPWAAYRTHQQILLSSHVRDRVVEQLAEDWAKRLGGTSKMNLPVSVRIGRGLKRTLGIAVTSVNREYAAAFLDGLLAEHRNEWESMQNQRVESATEVLEQELSELEDKIRKAEDDLFEYERLNDVTRLRLKASHESNFFIALVRRQQALSTELILLEQQFPELKGEGVGVISEVGSLTQETGLQTRSEQLPSRASADGTEQNASPWLDDALGEDGGRVDREDMGWQETRLKITQLERRRAELLKSMLPEHPQIRSINKEIEDLAHQLDVAAELKFLELQDRHKALRLQLQAVEAAEYRWQAKYLAGARTQTRLARLQSVVDRYEQNHQALYTRLNSMRASEELKREYYEVVSPVSSSPKPVSPDAAKVLLVALAIGVASGFGLVLLFQFFDNKVQTIADVEKDLGMRFLGGVPYWMHSGLEKAIRPIVTEEHSTGAIEAYRALRTALLSELDKIHEKVIMVTSADSREGKTLTTLNLAIMTAHMGKRVLLVDMDLRRGRIHRSLGLPREPGVTDALRDGRSLREVIVPSRIENLDVAPTGSSLDDSAETLQSTDLVRFFIDVQDEYDVIFLDTSPILRVTDPIILASQGVGVVVYVARVNHTAKPLIKYSLDLLRDAKVVGLIMNSIEMHKISSLYYAYQYPNYAYYSNAYAYGYNYYNYGEGGSGGSKQRRRGGIYRAARVARRWLRRTIAPF